jgi:hypothetical protein
MYVCGVHILFFQLQEGKLGTFPLITWPAQCIYFGSILFRLRERKFIFGHFNKFFINQTTTLVIAKEGRVHELHGEMQ